MSAERLLELRTLPYALYLRTPEWVVRRNRALKIAWYRCARCEAPRDLQVHHLSYDRLGAEQDDDLQVLCRGCHLGHHVVAIEARMGVYFKVVTDVLKAEQFTMLADLIEAVKVRCARLRLPYSDGPVQSVIARMKLDRLVAAVPKRYDELLERGEGYQPFTKAEAAGLMATYGAVTKSMPSVPRFTRKQADSLIAIRKLRALAVDQARRCREAERVAAEAEVAAVFSDRGLPTGAR